ncbi:MAG: hypothetical protein PHP57_04035 [Sideroxydans sp.]|nr:hypothetical protein [Sideroxydans sp.]
MMTFTDWTGLTSVALVWVVLVMLLPVVGRLSARLRVALAMLVYGLVMWPWLGLSMAEWLRGMLGDLSLTSVLLLGTAIYARTRSVGVAEIWDARERYSLLLFLAVSALLLYPFALGLGTLDPYRSGFGGVSLIVLLSLLSLWALRRNLRLLPLTFSLVAMGWSLGIYESTNLWDYLIDAPLAIYALGAVVRGIWIARRRGQHV